MTTTESHKRQFFSCCIFWGREFCQLCNRILTVVSILAQLSTPRVWTEVKYNSVCHIYSLSMDTLLHSLAPYSHLVFKQPSRKDLQIHCILPSYELWLFFQGHLLDSHEQEKNQLKLDEERYSFVSGAGTCELHLTCRTINGTIISLSLFHSPCSSPTVQVFLKLG